MDAPTPNEHATPRSPISSVSFSAFDPLCSVFRRTLKSAGLKYTPERAQILDTVLHLHDQSGIFEAERVLEHVKQSGFRVSKATVYRTLRLLQDAGILQRVPFADDQSHYQLVFGGKAQDLVIRTDTGQAIPIEVPELLELEAKIIARLGLKSQGHRLLIFASAT